MFPIYLKETDSEPLPEDPIFYWITGSGIFLVKNHLLFHSKTRVKEIPWLAPEEAYFRFRGPRLPRALVAKVLALFLGTWERYKTESMVLLYFRPAGKDYRIVVPRQIVGGIHCVYEDAQPEAPEDIRVGTIHSHGREEAFHSDRDNEDETFQDGLHLIFGNLDTIRPTFVGSAMVDGRRFPLKPEELLEGMPGREEIEAWKKWAEDEITRQVRPLKKPVYFGT